MVRVAALLLVLCSLAGCSGGPQAFGLTGPRGSQLGATPGSAPGEDPVDNPNAFQSGTRYSPSAGPSTGAGNFWGYN